MGIRALSEGEIQAALSKAPLWRLEGREIVRTLGFPSFSDSIRFVQTVAVEADRADHHPDILVQYNRVTLRLSTHDANGLSERDFAFARVVDGMFPTGTS